MKTTFCFFSATTALGAVLSAATAEAQMSRATFESLPMPGQATFPDSRWQNVQFGYTFDFDAHYWSSADYGRVLLPDAQQSNNPDNVWYLKLWAPENAQVQIGVFWDYPIPPGSYDSMGRWRDSCTHSHFGYAAFAEYAIFNGSDWIQFYQFRASEGRVGRRYDWVNGQYRPVVGTGKPELACYVTSDPDDLYGFLSDYIWRNNIQAIQPVTYTYAQSGTSIVSLVLMHIAMQGATHGWGPCGQFQCFPQVGAIAFRMQ